MHKALSLLLELPFAEAATETACRPRILIQAEQCHIVKEFRQFARIYIFKLYKFGLQKLFYFL
jgi:hypothetical protein